MSLFVGLLGCYAWIFAEEVHVGFYVFVNSLVNLILAVIKLVL